MKYVRKLGIICFTIILGLSTTLFAQPRIGEKMPEFSLQDTGGHNYGVNHSSNTVSVLFFVGNW